MDDCKIEDLGRKKEDRKFYKEIEDIKIGPKTTLTQRQSQECDLITSQEGVLNHWMEHFYKIPKPRKRNRLFLPLMNKITSQMFESLLKNEK